jgi:conjugal transfer pilus assembly protein TraV
MRAPIHLAHLSALASAVLLLPGCTSMSGLSGSSSYACKAPEGVTCDSVSGTYANAVQNNLPSQRQRRTAPGSSERSDLPQPSMTAASAPGVTASLPPTPVSLRSSPRILRLWFKPWEDADRDLYDQGYVYVQIDAGQWQIEHVQRQIRDAYAPLKAPPRVTSADGKDATPLPAHLKSTPRPLGEGTFPGPQTPTAPVPRGGDTTE